MQLSEKILALRKSRGMSQEDLAAALGVSRQTVSRWEVGSALPDAENLLQLSLLFKVSADYLLGLVDVPRPIDNTITPNEQIALGLLRQLNEEGQEAAIAILKCHLSRITAELYQKKKICHLSSCQRCRTKDSP